MNKSLKLLVITLCILGTYTLILQARCIDKTFHSSSADADIPQIFHKKLKGKIGENLLITMYLNKRDSLLTGSYYYDKNAIPISLFGQFMPNAELKLSETNSKFEETGIFKGKFTSEEIFEGLWINPKTNKKLPFILRESKEETAHISFENFHEENCKNRDKNLKKPQNDDMWWTDTLCSSIDIELIKIATENAMVNKRINESISQSIYSNEEQTYHSVQEYVQSIHQLEDREFLVVEYNFDVLNNENNILCIGLSIMQNAGGAHPMSGISYTNYYVKTGQEIKLNEILIPNFSDKLDAIGEKIFVKTYDEIESVWFFKRGEFKLNENFSILAGGLLFTFNTYEIGPYAAGAPEVFIPYRDIQEIINPDGILKRFTSLK